MSRKITVATALLVMLTLVLTACAPAATPVPTQPPAPTKAAAPAPTQPPAPSPTPVPKKNVNSAGVELPADAAPANQQIFRYTGIEGKHVDPTKNIYESSGMEGYAREPLVWLDSDFKASPGAAEKWQASADGLTWTLNLRKDAKWSDGTPVTADDWVFSFRRMLSKETANPYTWFYGSIKNAAKYAKGEVKPEELGVEKVDDYTLKITTEQPTPYLPMILGFIATIAPKHMVDKYGDAWATKPETALSNGPYMLKEWNKGKNVVYVPNPYYKGPATPKLEQIIISFVPQDAPPTVILQMYKANEIDWMTVGGAGLAQAIADAELKGQLDTFANFVTYYMHFALNKPPFDNLKVRQAFSHAIDREAISKQVMQGLEIPAYTHLPPGFPCSQATNKDIQAIQKYDPALAKKLMEEAGFKDGQGFPTLELWTRQGQVKTESEAIQRMLKENLGVNVTPKDVERAVYMEKLGKYEISVGLIQWYYDYTDPTNFMDWWTTGARHPWKNEKFNQLVIAARGELDPDKRCKMYQEAEKILIEDVGAVFIGHPINGELWKTNVGGLKVAASGARIHYQRMWTDIYIKQTK